MRIVVTDSGLGGLSVLGELEMRLKQFPIFESIELIFFNSLYDSNYGYNLMQSDGEKARVFNSALNSIEKKFNPDSILIACNTLSVVYPNTSFSNKTKILVSGILESGVELFRNKLSKSSNTIILFGTPTTINSNVYKNALLKTGIFEKQIINQPCYELETKIQNDPISMESRKEISKFVKEALRNYNNDSEKIFAGLCCTHYGFSEKIFYEEFSKMVDCKVEILNPNSGMLNFLFNDKTEFYPNISVSVRLVSRVRLKQIEINSLSKILLDKSPKTANSLLNYEFVEDLF